MSKISNVGLGINLAYGPKILWKSRIDITPLHIYSSLMNCFDKVIFHHFCNESKFHILSIDGKHAWVIIWYQNLNFVKKWT